MLKLLWFSPLPPAQTDIANYTARIASTLGHLADITFVDPHGGPTASSVAAVPLASLSPRDINRADLCVYQIGNNPDFHGEIFNVAQRHPGLVVLHDRAIHEFLLLHFAAVRHRSGITQREAYRQAMAHWYGASGMAAAYALEQGACEPRDLAARFPLFEAVMERALGAVCHNPQLMAELRARFPKLPVLSLPLPYPAPSAPPPRPLREPGARIRLVMFGFMATNRRATEFLEVWGRSGHRDRFELHIAGRLSDRARFDRMSADLGLAAQIEHHGYLSDGALDALIASADMALNLRNPSMGEASGSQLRIWANACPSAVSDDGWYATVPSACVRRISIAHEADDLALLLEDLAAQRLDLSRMGQRGFLQLQQHDPERYVRNLIAWIAYSLPAMASAWAETALISTFAGACAEVLPPLRNAGLPRSLLNPIRVGEP